MPRLNATFAIAAAVALSVASTSLSAQEAQSATPELTGIAPVVVTARKMNANELRRDNFRLRRELAAYDRTIAHLEKRLHRMKTVVTDSLQRDISTFHASADSTRARRLALEAMLSKAESHAGRAHATTFR